MARGQRGGRAERRVEQELERAERRTAEALRRADRRTGEAFERARRAAEGPLWTQPEPGRRRPRFSREQIAEAGIAIADREGLDAVSMRRVAGELGAGTMTLYHYVRTKDDLVALMDNAIMGELLVPDDELPPDWRAALTLIARRTRDSLARHPWTLEASSEAQIGPNGLRHMEQSVASVAELGLDLAASFEIISLVDDYVFGHAQRRRLPGPQDPERRERWLADAFDYIDAEVARGDFPRLRELLGEGGIRPVWEDLRTADDEDERFERGLSRLLDGIALDLERGGPKASAKPRRSRRAGGSPPSTRSSTRRRT